MHIKACEGGIVNILRNGEKTYLFCYKGDSVIEVLTAESMFITLNPSILHSLKKYVY